MKVLGALYLSLLSGCVFICLAFLAQFFHLNNTNNAILCWIFIISGRLNKNRYQVSRERNAFERKVQKGSPFNYEAFMEEENVESGKEFKGHMDEEDMDDEEVEEEEVEDEEFEMENQAKRSRMDDDVEIVVAKKVRKTPEGEIMMIDAAAVGEKVFCDRKNGKKGREVREEVKKIDQDDDGGNENLEAFEQKKTSQKSTKADGKEREGKSATINLSMNDPNIPPTKKLCLELEMNFASHDKILNEYIEGTSNESASDIQRHVEQLIVEIQTLNDMIRAKELEWNNMIHLKKVKEEIVARLTRKRHVLEYTASKFGSSLDYTAFAGGDDVHKLTKDSKNIPESSMTKLTQAILLNRANEQQKNNSNSAESR